MRGRTGLRGHAALLESYGIEVRDYASAGEFLLSLPAQSRGCVLLDLHMPGMSGLELLDMLRTAGSRLPLVRSLDEATLF
jgi:FixJ family two-component response regulator